jgi:sugar phosphate permease
MAWVILMDKLSNSTGATPQKVPRIFFGWWTLLAACILQITALCYYSYGISAIFKPLSKDLNFSRTVTSAASSIGKLEGGLEAPLSGWLVDRFGPKWVMFAGVTLIGIGLILMYFIQSTWAYFAVWGVTVGTGVNISMTIPIDKTLTSWFMRKRGIAIGIKFACIGAGGALVVPVVTWLIEGYGWRMTSVIWAMVTFASLLFILFFVRQKRPEYYGLLPDGARVGPGASQADVARQGAQYAADFQETEFTLKQALKTSAFWLYLTAYAFQWMGQGAINLHLIPFLTDRGIDAMVAGGMMSLMLFATIPSRLLAGAIADRVKKSFLPYMLAISFFLQTLGLGAFLMAPGTVTIFVLLVLYGLGNGAAPTIAVLMRGRFFGRKAYGSISGINSFIMAPFGMVAPIYAGWVYDTTGSYVNAFTTFAALALAATLIICFVRPPKPPVPAAESRTSF